MGFDCQRVRPLSFCCYLHATYCYGKFRPFGRSAPRAVLTPMASFKEVVGAHARIRTGDLFLTKEMLYRLSYVGGAAASRFYRAGEATLAASSCLLLSTTFSNGRANA